ncbi:MAG: sigma-70 family RNA polymerase sigma factor [Pseudomonadota bacterium]
MPDSASFGPTSEPRFDLMINAIAERMDRDAFATLFEHFAPRVKAYLLRLGMANAAAEDLAQEVLLTVWHKAATYDRSQAGASTWIFTIARNKRIDVLRRENRPTLDPNDPALVQEPDALADEVVSAADQAKHIRDAIAELPAEQAELVRLAFYHDHAHGVIAEKTGLPLGTVKSRLRLALIKLRRALNNDDQPE